MLSAAKVGVGGVSIATDPHPGLRFASAFPPHRFAGGGFRPEIGAIAVINTTSASRYCLLNVPIRLVAALAWPSSALMASSRVMPSFSAVGSRSVAISVRM